MTPLRAFPVIACAAALCACGNPTPAGTAVVVGMRDAGGTVQLVDSIATVRVARDPIALDSVRAEGTTLRLSISHAGGCAEHAYALAGERPGAGSEAGRGRVLLAHDAGGDACEALIRRELAYDLRPLVIAHREAGWTGDTLPVAFQGTSWRVNLAP